MEILVVCSIIFAIYVITRLNAIGAAMTLFTQIAEKSEHEWKARLDNVESKIERSERGLEEAKSKLDRAVDKLEFAIKSCQNLVSNDHRVQKITSVSDSIQSVVSEIKETVIPALNSTQNSPFIFKGGMPKKLRQWFRVKVGMSHEDVKGLLGIPPDVVNEDGMNYWTYGESYGDDGSVHFDFEKKTVNEWDIEINKVGSDSSKFKDVKDNMSPVEIVAILGNPKSIGFDCSSDDKEYWNECWYYAELDEIYINSCFIRFSYPERKWIKTSISKKRRDEINKKNAPAVAKFDEACDEVMKQSEATTNKIMEEK